MYRDVMCSNNCKDHSLFNKKIKILQVQNIADANQSVQDLA